MTTSFGYSADKLTSFGGSSISYNTMGCPTSYDGMSATWSKGKLSRLSSGTLASGTSNYTYTYNAFGQRVAKTYSYLAGTSGLNPVQAGDVTAYNKKYYYDHAGRLVAEEISKTVHGTGTVTERIVFLYDESSVIGIEHTTGGVSTRYYFQRNLLGDVQAIVNTNGTVVARYLYDAFGNCTIASSTTNTAVANANPIRYRGYYYDDELGLYYLQSRYYNPTWGRFINADALVSTGQGILGNNMFAYCLNNPVIFRDNEGASAICVTNGDRNPLMIGNIGLGGSGGGAGGGAGAIGLSTIAAAGAAVTVGIVVGYSTNQKSDSHRRLLADVKVREQPSQQKLYRLAYVNKWGMLIKVGPKMTFTEALSALGVCGAVNSVSMRYMYDVGRSSDAQRFLEHMGTGHWGIYASTQYAAKALAVVFGSTSHPEVHGLGMYGHYHDYTHTFHIWFGGVRYY